MAFELVPGTRALALPWLWIVTGEPWSRCALALGTGDHAGLAALALDGGAGRGFVAASLAGTVDLGGGPSARGAVLGLHGGAPVVTDGSRYLFRSARFGWVVSRTLAEPDEWRETVFTYAVSGGTASETTEAHWRGTEFWSGTPPSALGAAAAFAPRGSIRDDGAAISVEVSADLAARAGDARTWGGISGDYAAFAGTAPPVASIGEFAPAGGAVHIYQAARLL